MLISELRVMRGPNMWSNDQHRLIVFKTDPAPFESMILAKEEMIKQNCLDGYGLRAPSDDIPVYITYFLLKLAQLIQNEHVYHVIESPAVGVCYGIMGYNEERAGRESVHMAAEILEAVILGDFPIPLSLAREKVRQTAALNSPGPTTQTIIQAALKRGIPVTEGIGGYTIFGYGRGQKKISAAISQHTSSIAVSIAGNKQDTKELLAQAGIPVPGGELVMDEKRLDPLVQSLGFPLVVKPLNGNQGRNITGNIGCAACLKKAFHLATEISKSVIVEKEIKGNDYRLLVIGNKFIAASLRYPPFVIGNGYASVEELIEKENSDHRRGNGHENALTRIRVDEATKIVLAKQKMLPHSIPASGQKVYLKTTANLSTGGTAEDVTDIIHPDNIYMAERVSKIIGLDICGIDVMTTDISQPLESTGGAVIEVNAAPGLRMHVYPNKGISRDVGNPIVDLMFEKEATGRIPIVAITGTNGKTTTTRLLSHIMSEAGHITGFTTTDGIYVNRKQIKRGDCSGPRSAMAILQDPCVDFAVLECARGGIIRSGLAFDQCDIAIVTNVAADHLGLKDIYTIEDLAKVKAVVPESVKPDGWAILNANDDLVYNMSTGLKCNIALFSSDPENVHIKKHLEEGGLACILMDNRNIFLCRDGATDFMIHPVDIPLTKGGKAGFMTENVLPAILAAHLSGLSKDQIREGLKSFIPSADETPGRINEFTINGVNVIVDYAHNPHGLRALAGYLKNIPEKKTGIITGTGDRRDEDIIEIGRISAGMYDEIIIRFDRDTRGRSKESIANLLKQGIRETKEGMKCHIVSDTKAALEFAISTAAKNSYVVISADDAIHTVEVTKEIAQEFEMQSI